MIIIYLLAVQGYFLVDDCIFYLNTQHTTKAAILSLKEELLLEKEDDMTGLLGLVVEQYPIKVTMVITQLGLLDQILDTMSMHDSNHELTLIEK